MRYNIQLYSCMSSHSRAFLLEAWRTSGVITVFFVILSQSQVLHYWSFSRGLGALVCRCPRPFGLALFCWPLVATYDAVHDDACNQQTCGKLMQIEKQLGHHSMPFINAIYIYIYCVYIYISFIHAYDLGGCKHWCGPAFGENECRSFHNAYGATPAWLPNLCIISHQGAGSKSPFPTTVHPTAVQVLRGEFGDSTHHPCHIMPASHAEAFWIHLHRRM